MKLLIARGRTKLLTTALLLSFTTACSSGPKVLVNALYQSQQCAVDESQLIFLDNTEQLYSFIESTQRFNLDNSSRSPDIKLPAAQGRAIVVALGKQNSGGYALTLVSNEAPIEASTLKLPVEISTPAEGTVSTQQLTSPCLVLGISSREGYSQVGAGELIFATPVSED